jgi:hypothetical protein
VKAEHVAQDQVARHVAGAIDLEDETSRALVLGRIEARVGQHEPARKGQRHDGHLDLVVAQRGACARLHPPMITSIELWKSR